MKNWNQRIILIGITVSVTSAACLRPYWFYWENESKYDVDKGLNYWGLLIIMRGLEILIRFLIIFTFRWYRVHWKLLVKKNIKY